MIIEEIAKPPGILYYTFHKTIEKLWKTNSLMKGKLHYKGLKSEFVNVLYALDDRRMGIIKCSI